MPRPARYKPGNLKPETEFRRAAVKYLKLAYAQHFFYLPIVGGPFQPSGSPDCVCCVRGIAVFIEWKAPGGRIGPKQQQMIDEIRAAGGRAGIVSSWNELKELLAGIEPVQKGFLL